MNLPASRSQISIKSTAPSNPFASSTTSTPPPTDDTAEADDFGAAWGDDDWNDDAGDPFSSPASTTTKPTAATTFDDKGEPDFAGWLSAQAQAKQKGKTPLPKGLTKATVIAAASSSARPGLGAKANSTGHPAPMRKVVAASARSKAAPVLVARKVEVEPRKKVEEEDEGWGDAWE